MIIREANLLFQLVEDTMGITKEQVLSGKRTRHFVDARRIIAASLKRNTGYKLWQISKSIGNKDHATVIYYLKAHDTLMEQDKNFRNNFNKIEVKFISYQNGCLPVEEKLKFALEERDKLNKEIINLRKLLKIKNT